MQGDIICVQLLTRVLFFQLVFAQKILAMIQNNANESMTLTDACAHVLAYV